MPVSFPHGLGELNGGLQIFKPSREKYERILNIFNTSGPGEFLFADQNLLSKTFKDQWTPLYISYWVFRANRSRPYIYNAIKPLRTAHAQIWKDEEVKNVHYILAKPRDDKVGAESLEDTHVWWWEIDKERREKEKEAGFEEPCWT
jgi:hypothetical protein